MGVMKKMNKVHNLTETSSAITPTSTSISTSISTSLSVIPNTDYSKLNIPRVDVHSGDIHSDTEFEDKSTLLDYTIRVRGGNHGDPDPSRRPTDHVGLSQSLLKMMLQNPERVVRVQCVGAKALFIACEAFRLAAVNFEKSQHGFVLVNRQSTYMANIAGRNAKGICLRIFPIPVRDAV